MLCPECHESFLSVLGYDPGHDDGCSRAVVAVIGGELSRCHPLYCSRRCFDNAGETSDQNRTVRSAQ